MGSAVVMAMIILYEHSEKKNRTQQHNGWSFQTEGTESSPKSKEALASKRHRDFYKTALPT
jgi:hypothetical protein